MPQFKDDILFSSSAIDTEEMEEALKLNSQTVSFLKKLYVQDVNQQLGFVVSPDNFAEYAQQIAYHKGRRELIQLLLSNYVNEE